MEIGSGEISGETVIVSSLQAPKPVAVRYAWADNPLPNLYNGAGFPSSPFRTDSLPLSTKDTRYPNWHDHPRIPRCLMR